ncbi:Ger(x)C family spore germination protein [Halalkalibacter krulwichiae]|uniref:Spore germination protein B3 n=1 Tax=Halalkalibacter krulwichiae TaxID=199441 RepID=A0A1X9MGM6_9BACI|nr:Ger(x)C family spore germination protein [Halalkalibacter krulwichiae]ARK32629.1 Spore germination protein B3 precursor [Halalkalibacter krulwichiae]
MRVWTLSLLLLSCLFVLSGCWDKKELGEFAFPVVIGLDQGEDDLLAVTFQIANPLEGALLSGGGTEDVQPSEIITLHAPDFLTARDLANIKVTKDIHFSHIKTIVVSEQLASSPTFPDYMQFILRERQLRRNMNIVVSKEKASEFIRNNQPQLERRPHKFFELMLARWKQTGLMPEATVNRFFERMDEGAGLFLANYATASEFDRAYRNEDEYVAGEVAIEGGNPTQMIGSAVFRNGVMIGAINGEETRHSLLLRPNTKSDNMIASFEDPLSKQHRVKTRMLKTKPTSIEIEQGKNQPTVTVKVPITIEVLGIPSRIDYVENSENRKLLKAAIEKQLQSKSTDLISLMKRKYKDEPFQWNLTVRSMFVTWPQYEQYDWPSQFQKAKVNVSYEVEITRFGLQLKPSE